jgi:ubiquinone biosynthesis UbiH/UbiF/VisC/COQ6 family hydroxylase
VVVAGGGAVGLAFACAAENAEVRVLEAAPGRAAALPGEFDLRIFALSPGTREFLREIGAWEGLAAQRMVAVRRMEVFGDGGARLSFSGPARGALAWIVEAGRLAAALEARAASIGTVGVARGVRAAAFEASAARVQVDLDDGERIEAELLVGADGPDSPVRRAFALAAHERPYGETALVANFEAERDHGCVARQWFRADGVLAWLPLPGRRISIVWSAPNEVAGELAGLDPQSLAVRVRDAGRAELGDLEAISPAGKFPLRAIDVPCPVAPGVALIGDAAHCVHPLAGQGVNLGFQDARVLARALAARSPLERPGDLAVLRRYARARREDVGAMQWVTGGLDRLFASPSPGAAALRNFGLRLVEAQPWAKRVLAGRAMR